MKPTLNEPDLPGADEANDEVIGTALVGSLVVLAVLAVIGGVTAWWLLQPVPPQPTETRALELPTARHAAPSELPAMPFKDITAEAGIAFDHEHGAFGEKLLPETMGSGCAVFDYDGDGDQDLLFVNSKRWPWDPRPAEKPATQALYRNDGKGKFDDVTVEAGLDISLYGMGVAAGDYDGDGDIDLYLSAIGRGRLLRNEGGKFQDVTDEAGVAGTDDDWGTSCGWFDYDRDGDLDLFACQYVVWSREFDVAQNFQLTGGGRAYGRPQQFGGTLCRLYRNAGDGKFDDVSEASGIQVKNPATGVPAGKSLGLAFDDFDADGWLDVLVANDTVGNFLFRNKQDGTFEEIGYLAGIAYDSSGLARGAMGIDTARFRNTQEIGVAIANFSNEMTALYVADGAQPQFRDDAVSNGLGPATRLELKFGIFFFDADLDGRLDMFSTNGHLEEDIHRVQATQHYAQPAHFFWNCGPDQPSEFARVPEEKSGSDILKPMVGRGAAYGDFDGDGDLDLVATASGGPARLLRNDQQLGHHWLRLKLVGKAPNRDAIGALVELHAAGPDGKDEVQRRLVSPTRSYLSQCELPVTFGLGKQSKIDKVVIRWPQGQTTEQTELEVDRLHVIEQPADDSAAAKAK